jgi:hypothetical protein
MPTQPGSRAVGPMASPKTAAPTSRVTRRSRVPPSWRAPSSRRPDDRTQAHAAIVQPQVDEDEDVAAGRTGARRRGPA